MHPVPTPPGVQPSTSAPSCATARGQSSSANQAARKPPHSASKAALTQLIRPPSSATTSKRQGGSTAAAAGSAAQRARCAAAWCRRRWPARRRGRLGARAHLDEDQRAVAIAQDQVDLRAARMGAARDPIIALHEREALALQIAPAPATRHRPRSPSSSAPARRLDIAPDLLLRAAAEAAGTQQYPAGALYVVATPIGNLADLTLRAIHVLGSVDAMACEDTRVSAGLLRHLGLDKPLIALHQHNETRGRGAVLQRLAQGERVAYVSDAGTPAGPTPAPRWWRPSAAAGCACCRSPAPAARWPRSAWPAMCAAAASSSSASCRRAVERAAALRRPGRGHAGATAVRGAAPHRGAGARAGGGGAARA